MHRILRSAAGGYVIHHPGGRHGKPFRHLGIDDILVMRETGRRPGGIAEHLVWADCLIPPVIYPDQHRNRSSQGHDRSPKIVSAET